MPTVIMRDENKSQNRKKGVTALLAISKSITESIKDNVDTTKFLYSITKSEKKIEVGSLVVNCRIASKEDSSNCKYLVFVVNRDDKTGMNHVCILDGEEGNESVIFAVTDRYPVRRLEKYVPSIIKSTQRMIR